MGAYVSGAKGGRVEEKRPDFKAGVLMAARHEWIASIRMMHVEGVIRVCSKKYGSLDVVIPDLAPSPTSTERIITDTAAMLEAEGFGPRIFCFKSPTSPVHDTILFMYSVDQVSWTDGEWDRNNDDRCIRKAKLQMKLLGGQFALDLESEEPHELTVLGAEILKRIYVVVDPPPQAVSPGDLPPAAPSAATTKAPQAQKSEAAPKSVH